MLTTAATTIIAPLLALQALGEDAVAIKNDNPETWTVEYPRVIRPFVVEYRQCLNVSNRVVTGEADFEEQHRADLPRCAEAAQRLIGESNSAMDGAKTTISPAEVSQLFANIGQIHIARGRDLDQQFTRRLSAAARAEDSYEATKPEGLIIELRDASVVKAAVEQASSLATSDTNPAGTKNAGN
ncbi:MAG: hypothetical protein AAF494_12895 [Pseudomonadota bacterium]